MILYIHGQLQGHAMNHLHIVIPDLQHIDDACHIPLGFTSPWNRRTLGSIFQGGASNEQDSAPLEAQCTMGPIIEGIFTL